MTCLKWQRIHELTGSAVIVSAESLKLTGLFIVGYGLCLANRITRESVGTAIHQIGLAPVL